ncbi:MAG: hypothetical protein IPM57_02715 [Oligoflexia bacterium]|nr:hypothetical protein [Oligoflexia bacterium]
MDKLLHVRRCHCCGEVQMSEDDILKCQTCQKPLLPFFYFDKKKNKDLDIDSLSQEALTFGPIRGLTAYW